MTLYDDCSGLDEADSYVQLKSGAKWILDTDPILLFAAELVPELPDGYKAIAWDIPESSMYKADEPQLSAHEVDVLFGPEPTSVDSEIAMRAYLEALLTCERKYHDDVWRGETSVGRELVRSALLKGKFTTLEEILSRSCNCDIRTPILLAVAIVEEIQPSRAQQAQPLVTMLLGDGSSLNEHWKSVLAGKVRT